MRFLVALLVVAFPLSAAAQSPPSKTLERGVKLYEKTDYLSASIELWKVESGETGDTPDNVQRGQWFLAKALYQLGFRTAALAWLGRIEADPGHAYRDAALKWVIAILREVPGGPSGALELLGRYDPAVIDDPQFAEVVDEYIVLRGRALLAQGNLDGAASLLGAVPSGSASWPAARLERGRVAFRKHDLDGGIAAMIDGAGDLGLAPMAGHDLAAWPRILGKPARALDALRKLAAGGSPAAPAAALEVGRLELEDGAPFDISVDTFDALAMVTVCNDGPVENLVAAAEPHAREALELMRRTLQYEDNAEAFESASDYLDDDAAAAQLIRIAVGPSEPLVWATALRRERAVFGDADAAWRTTSIAVEVETELALQNALAEADAGKWLRDRFAAIAHELEAFNALDRTIPAHDDPSRPGIPVVAALCKAAGLPVHETTAPPPIDPPPPPRAKGCAGCASTGGDAAPVLLLLVLLVVRRTARRQMTPAG